jgi:hypothetical protein
LLALLGTLGAVTGAGERQPGWALISVGDLVHGGVATTEATDDLACLALGLRLFDVLLLGNHELPFAYPAAGFPHFVGQGNPDGPLGRALAAAAAQGRYVPALAYGDWLLSHAGLTPEMLRSLLPALGLVPAPGLTRPAADEADHGSTRAGAPRLSPEEWPPLPSAAQLAATVATLLGTRFAARVTGGGEDPLFDAIGYRRGGFTPTGGIFWADFAELCRRRRWGRRPVQLIAPLRQIVGHTPQQQGPACWKGEAWCVDGGAALSGKVVALVTEDGGAVWTPVVCSSPQPLRRAHRGW